MSIQGVSPSRAAVTSGVPQWSILGLLLFLLAFNGFFEVPLSSGSFLDGYADDVTYCAPIHSDADIVAANADLSRLSNWIGESSFRL